MYKGTLIKLSVDFFFSRNFAGEKGGKKKPTTKIIYTSGYYSKLKKIEIPRQKLNELIITKLTLLEMLKGL